jgi:integrase
MAKRGRHAEHYRSTWGEIINGLARRPSDKRWRIIGTDITYTEPDESVAIARFRRWQSQQAKQVVGFDRKVVAPRTEWQIQNDGLDGFRGVVFLGADEETTVTTNLPADVVWEKLRQLILKDPSEAEQKTGIKGLARLIAQGPSGPGVPLARLWGLYEQTHKHITAEKLAAYKKVWDGFADFVAVPTVDLISADMMRAYREAITAMGHKASYTVVYFKGVRTVVNNALKEGEASEDVHRLANLVKMLRTDNGHNNGSDPHPISPDDFKALLAVGKDPLDRCLLLVGLNASYYAVDLARLPVDAVNLADGIIRFDRAKTGGTTRVCVLWPETVKAIKAYQAAHPHNAKTLFVSRTGRALDRNVILSRFAALRDAAGVPDSVTFSHLRDGATCAQDAGVSGELIDCQLGHKLPGQRDKYIKRSPASVRPVADAMHKHYFGEV